MEFFAATCHRRWEYLRFKSDREITLYIDGPLHGLRKIHLALWPTDSCFTGAGVAAPGELPGELSIPLALCLYLPYVQQRRRTN